MINIKYHDHEYFERRMSCEGHLKCFKQSWSSTSTLYKRRFPKKRFQAITFDWRSTSVSYSLMLFFWDTPLGHIWSYGRRAIYGQNGHLCHNTASNKFMCVEAKFIYKFYYKQIDEEETITISWWENFLWWDQIPTLHCKSDSNARSWSHFKSTCLWMKNISVGMLSLLLTAHWVERGAHTHKDRGSRLGKVQFSILWMENRPDQLSVASSAIYIRYWKTWLRNQINIDI